MAEVTRKLVARAKKVAYANTGTVDVPIWTRMKGFTSLPKTKEAIEYTRQYVDELMETTDTVGMSESQDFEFDKYTNDAVHIKIAKVFDEELIGDDANLEIMVVDYTPTLDGTVATEFDALKRTYSIIPDTEGDGTEAYKYSGTFKAKSKVEKVKVTAPEGADSLVVTIGTAGL